jgi:hypothetical protein
MPQFAINIGFTAAGYGNGSSTLAYSVNDTFMMLAIGSVLYFVAYLYLD